MSLNNKDEKNIDIPDIENHHYYIFSSEFDNVSTSDAMRFIIARNLMVGKDRPKQMKLIINSPGGSVPSAFALIDTIKGSKVPVYTYGMGEIASCGLMMFIAGEKAIVTLLAIQQSFHINTAGDHTVKITNFMQL